MTLKFLDMYNAAAAQEWSMYDSDTTTNDEFVKSLVVALNKAITEVLYSYPFSFRERTHVIFTIPNQNSYDMPSGLILKDKENSYSVKINSNPLKFIANPINLSSQKGIPDSFYIKGNKIVLYPTPAERSIVTIDYLTLVIGENKNSEGIFYMQDKDDTFIVPAHLEELFKNTVISRTMLNTIASESDENYSAYKRQSENMFRQLVKYSKGVGLEKAVKM